MIVLVLPERGELAKKTRQNKRGSGSTGSFRVVETMLDTLPPLLCQHWDPEKTK